MNDATANLFTIEENVALPPRTIPNAGPRESKYPVDTLQPGQAFAVPVTDEKQARQKQSQFSGLAKSRGISLVTRFFAENSPFKNTPAPCLGVWHDGPAKPKKAKAAPAPAATDGNAGSNEASATPAAPAAPAAPVAPAAAEDTVVL